MSELDGVVPAIVALLALALVVALIVLAVRVTRRSPRARTAATQAVGEAAEALLRLDDAVDELDAAFRTADVVDAADEPTDLRRARAGALRARDRGFAEVSRLEADTGVAAVRRDDARRLRAGLDQQLDRVARIRAQLDDWVRVHRSAPALLTAARRRRDELAATMGDPEPLLAALRARFAPDDRDEAETAAYAASEAIRDADAALESASTDPEGCHLAAANTALTRAERQLRAVEDAHRIALQAADNAPAELTAARGEIDAAIELTSARSPEASPEAVERLHAAARELDSAAAQASARPRRAITVVARAREVRDEVLGDSVSPRHRLEAARAALPGTLACARAALAAADARDTAGPIVERLRREHARRELAAARAATDAEQALAHARAAWHAVSPS